MAKLEGQRVLMSAQLHIVVRPYSQQLQAKDCGWKQNMGGIRFLSSAQPLNKAGIKEDAK